MKKDVLIKFTLKLKVEKFGRYIKGDIDHFSINVFNPQNGLLMHPINCDVWSVIDWEILEEHSNKALCKVLKDQGYDSKESINKLIKNK